MDKTYTLYFLHNYNLNENTHTQAECEDLYYEYKNSTLYFIAQYSHYFYQAQKGILKSLPNKGLYPFNTVCLYQSV